MSSIFREHKTVADRSASDRRRHKKKIEKAIKEGIHDINDIIGGQIIDIINNRIIDKMTLIIVMRIIDIKIIQIGIGIFMVIVMVIGT